MARANPYYDGPRSDHFDGERFFNPGHPSTDRSIGQVWRWKSARGAVKWPSEIAVRSVMPEKRVDHLRVTMVGHATLLIQVARLNFLTDPVWSDRTSPVSFAGPKRVTVPGVDLDALPPIDVVLLSHNHYDHLDKATLRHLHAAHRPLIVTPLGNDTILKKVIPGVRVVTGDWNDQVEVGPSATVSITSANHWSGRGISDRRMALWSGFFVRVGQRSVWFAGDTGYGNGEIFRDMKARFGAPDVALIPIGAYAPRWFMAAQHTDPAEALKIYQDLGARNGIGIHWGTFQLTDEGRDEPRHELATALSNAGIAAERFVAAEPGQVFDY